jgi:hypothetical protein
MTGASLPYHLRPHKAVDRRIFVDLLRRFERWRSLSQYTYLSMGAYPLEDHKLVHRALGITRLIAFDLDGSVVDRQKFNKPIARCQCLHKSAGEVIAQLHNVLTESGCHDGTGVVVWLDYTSPKGLGLQLREFESLLGQLRDGDIVRVTVNAHPAALSEGNDASKPSKRPLKIEEKRELQFHKLKTMLGDMLPSTAKADDVTLDGLPKMLAGAFAAAALKALPVSGTSTFKPLSITRYRDGQQMLSISGTVVAQTDQEPMMTQLDLATWSFASPDWSDIHNLVVPDLTVRERLFLEREVLIPSPVTGDSRRGFPDAGAM